MRKIAMSSYYAYHCSIDAFHYVPNIVEGFIK